MGCGASAGAPYKEDTKKPEEEEGEKGEKGVSSKDQAHPPKVEEQKTAKEETEKKDTEAEEKHKREEEEKQRQAKEQENKQIEEEQEKKRLEEEEKKKRLEEEEKKKKLEEEEKKKRLEEEEEKRKAAEEEVKRAAEDEKLAKQERRDKEVLDYTPIQALGDLKVDVEIVVSGPGDGKRACIIIEVEIFGKVKVHYKGFKRDFDEWLQKTSYRILGILAQSTIVPVVEAAAPFYDKFRPYVNKADSLQEAADKICDDFKLAAKNPDGGVLFNSESFAHDVYGKHPDLGLDAIKNFYQALLDFLEAKTGTQACELSSISSLFDAFKSACCDAKKRDAFTAQFQSALLDLKGIFKEDGLDGDENGPWFQFE